MRLQELIRDFKKVSYYGMRENNPETESYWAQAANYLLELIKLRKASKWHKTSEKLPAYGMPVLVYGKTLKCFMNFNSNCYVAILTTEACVSRDYFTNGHGTIPLNYVSHWKEIVEP